MPVITDISQLDLTKTYTYADYLTWRFEGVVELIKGKVRRMSPAPRVRHQQISFRLNTLIGTALRGKTCQGFAAPFDVRLLKTTPNGDAQSTTVVQPDLCVVCDPAKLDEFGAEDGGGSAARFDAFMKDERAKWAAVVKARGIKLES